MKRPAVFFDRDNTLIVSEGYLGDPSKVQLVDGAAEAVARARSLGYAVVVFSNQSGVARGMFNENDVQRVNARLDELLADAQPQAVIDRHEYCPFHPEGTVPEYASESDLRKPKPGMILQAAEKLALDLSRSWVIGDAPRDIEAGKAAGCKTIWYKDTRLPPSPAARELMLTVPDAVASTLKEAVDVIARDSLVRHAGPPAEAASGSSSRARPGPAAASPLTPERPIEEVEEPAAPEPQSSAPEPPQEPKRSTGVGPRSVASAKPLMQVLAQKRAAASAASESQQAQPPAGTEIPPIVSMARLEELAEQILQELQRRDERPEADFSVSKLLAGIMQIVALAVLLLAYLIYRTSPALNDVLLVAIFLQAFTIALLIMGRQR
ncbi:MAG TPA: HAD family hydrolase [Tepidisphaeraceae bacterium]|nr:HAD family hydrolase [Tepidisphaeraceae bacterium]